MSTRRSCRSPASDALPDDADLDDDRLPVIRPGGPAGGNRRMRRWIAVHCLDTADADPYKDGAGLVLRTCDDSYRQSWVMAFDPVRPNTVRLVNFHSKLVVTVTGPNTKLVGLVVTAYQPSSGAQVFFTDNCLQCG
jgi:hypothetical protein